MATAAALPPDEPPAVRVVSQGLREVPWTPSVVPKMHNSGTFVSPTTTAPAARNRATVTWSWSAGVSGVAAEPTRLDSPVTGRLSFTATGTPARGSSARSARAATSSASARAASARTTRNAPIRPSSRSIRARCSATTSRGVTRFSRTAAAISAAVRPIQLVTGALLLTTREYVGRTVPRPGRRVEGRRVLDSHARPVLDIRARLLGLFRGAVPGRGRLTCWSSDQWPNLTAPGAH